MDYDLSFSDWIDMVETKLFTDQWIVLYSRLKPVDGCEERTTYSGLIRKKNIPEALRSSNWDRTPYNGLFGIVESYNGNTKKTSYTTYHDDVVEPLVYIRDFEGSHPPVKCVLDELVLLFNLLKRTTPGEDGFVFTDDNGNEIMAIELGQDVIRIQKRFLFEYMYIKKMQFVVFYDIWRFSKHGLEELGLTALAENVKKENANYNLFIDEDNQYVRKGKAQGWILGKHVIELPKAYKSWYWGADISDKEYESYIIGECELGNPIKYSCNPNNLSNYFGKNKGNPHYLTPVYFRLEVMQKYFSNPSKFRVDDSIVEMISRWSLRIDNNHSEAIVVFLGDLGGLPTQEQKYWQSYNIAPLGGISRVAFSRGFLAEFTEPEAPDLLFKRDLSEFYKKWFSHFNWYLFKPLSDKDAYRLQSLHMPPDESEIDFKNQIEAIAVILNESINVQALREIVGPGDDNEKGISLFDKYFKHIRFTGSDFTTFLRNLNVLRNSKLHRQSKDSNQKLKADVKRSHEYFSIDEKTNSDVIKFILNSAREFLFEILEFSECNDNDYDSENLELPVENPFNRE